MKKLNQYGAAHLVAVVAVVIVVVIAAGFMVYSNNNKSNQKSSNQNQPSVNPSSKETTKTSQEDEETVVKNAAKNHFELGYQKNLEEAYKSTCQGFKDNITQATFISQWQEGNYDKIDLSAIEYTSVDVRNNQAKISGSVGPLQPNSDLYVSLLKDNGQWCVYGYQVK